jgi:chromosomal replication initiation ATPase DnaA
VSEQNRQLPLALPILERFEREDFLVGEANELAYATLEQWPDWPDPVMLLLGPPGSGKTHLASIWAKRAHAWSVVSTDISHRPAAELLSSTAVLIEDVDRGLPDEAAFFHLLNIAREKKCFVLLTARTPPGDWGIKTMDLLSRLRLAPRIDLREPDDALMAGLLVKFFVERQMVVDMQVVDFIRSRIDRSVASVRDFVDALNSESLARKKRITRNLARELWKSHPESDPGLPFQG